MIKTIISGTIFLSMALNASVAFSQGRMIAVDSSRALFEVDINTGAKTSIGTVSANAGTTGGLAYDRATGTIYLTSTSNDALYTLDITTGTATLIGDYGDPNIVMHGLEFDNSTNTLYAASGGSTTAGNFYTVNRNTGFASLVGNSGLGSFHNLVHDSLNNVMYGTNSGTDSFYVVDRATGSFTLVGALLTSTNPNGLAYNWNNDTIYLVDNSTDNFYSIDRLTGAATVIGAMGSGNLLGLVYVPEPSSFATTMIGLALMTLARRSATRRWQRD